MILADLTDRQPDAQGDHAGAEERLLLRARSHHRQDDLRPAVSPTRRGRRSIDMETGRPVETEQARYRYTPVRLSPSPVGAHHWPPMAFNPVTKLVYYPGQETAFVCRDGGEVRISRKGRGTSACSAARRQFRNRRRPIRRRRQPGGFFVAWDPIANKEAWHIPFQPSGGALSMAGQLIFVGNSAGKFMALDPVTRQDAVGTRSCSRVSRRRSAMSWTASSTSP